MITDKSKDDKKLVGKKEANLATAPLLPQTNSASQSEDKFQASQQSTSGYDKTSSCLHNNRYKFWGTAGSAGVGAYIGCLISAIWPGHVALSSGIGAGAGCISATAYNLYNSCSNTTEDDAYKRCSPKRG